MSELVALLFGAAIVVVFAYDRFNRAGYEGGQQFERLVEFLSPDKLRARRIVLRAYMFYAATLLVIYVFLCTYAEVMPLLGGEDLLSGTIGASAIPATQSPEAAADAAVQPLSGPAAPKRFFPPSSVSLTIALIMVGLAPSFPILQRFEHWMRNTAHRLAGIPTRVVEVADSLRHSRLDLAVPDKAHPVPADTLLIPRGDWQRMAHYLSVAEVRLTSPEDFRDDLAIIFAVSAWVLERKLKLSATRDRLRFEPLEGALRKRSEALIEALDEKSGYAARSKAQAPGAAPDEADAAAAPGERRRGGWERLAREADDLADDLCVLLALYLEHDIIIAGSAGQWRVALTAEAETSDPKDRSQISIHQHSRAKAKLEEFLGINGGRGTAKGTQSHVLLAWLWTAGVVIAVSLLWSVFPGRLESAMQRGARDWYLVALDNVFTGFSSFAVPMIVALALRDAGLQSRHWGNMWSAHWTRCVPQAVFVVVSSWAVATLILIPTNTWMSAVATGWTAIRDSWAFLGWYFQYMGPLPLRGAVLGLIVVMLLDAQAMRPPAAVPHRTWVTSLAWATQATVVMALIGGLTRYMSSLAAAHRFMRDGLDAIDRGLIVYAGLYSAVIGFFVVFCVSEAVLNAREARSRTPGSDAPDVPARLAHALMPLLLAFGALLMTVGPAMTAPAGAATIRIAVRVDARPFIWRDQGTGKFVGFLWDICTEAVQRAGYSFTETEVMADRRAGFLATGTDDFDLLCDPTTITLGRMENFATGKARNLQFSPIVFAANASYLSNGPAARNLADGTGNLLQACVPLIAAMTVESGAEGSRTEVADKPAGRPWLSWLQRRFDVQLRPDPPAPPPKGTFEIWGYVGGSTVGEQLETIAGADDGTVRCLAALPSHSIAAEEFCAGRMDRYYGDLDIVTAAVAENGAAGGACRDHTPTPAAPISYEPYAFVVSSRLADFPERFALALYGMFEDGTVERLFSSHFAESRKSPYLSTLFRLNSVPVGAPLSEPPS